MQTVIPSEAEESRVLTSGLMSQRQHARFLGFARNDVLLYLFLLPLFQGQPTLFHHGGSVGRKEVVIYLLGRAVASRV